LGVWNFLRKNWFELIRIVEGLIRIVEGLEQKKYCRKNCSRTFWSSNHKFYFSFSTFLWFVKLQYSRIGCISLVIDTVSQITKSLNVISLRVILGRRKISWFHPEIWLYSGILVIFFKITRMPLYSQISGWNPKFFLLRSTALSLKLAQISKSKKKIRLVPNSLYFMGSCFSELFLLKNFKVSKCQTSKCSSNSISQY
jgi:hypothetical protein